MRGSSISDCGIKGGFLKDMTLNLTVNSVALKGIMFRKKKCGFYSMEEMSCNPFITTY